MRPRKAKEFIPEVASELQLEEALVESVINYYWSEVRKQLSALAHTRIHITNLGDFTIKHWKVDDKIQLYEQWEKKMKDKGLECMITRYNTVEQIYNLKNIKKILESENQRKDFIKLYKTNSNELKKEPSDNMEEQGTDC